MVYQMGLIFPFDIGICMYICTYVCKELIENSKMVALSHGGTDLMIF